jgi:hypothetical protein
VVSAQGFHRPVAITYFLFADTSLSASALESALLSNIRGGGGSRLWGPFPLVVLSFIV